MMETVIKIFLEVVAMYFCIIGAYAGYTFIRDDQRREKELRERNK